MDPPNILELPAGGELPPLPASPSSPSGLFVVDPGTLHTGTPFPSVLASPPPVDPDSDEVISQAVGLSSTWRDMDPARAPLYLRALLNRPRPELSRAVVDLLLSSDACLAALLDFIIRPVGNPFHEGAGSLGQDALVAAAAGLLPRGGGGGGRGRGPVWPRAARARAVCGRRRSR